MNTNDTQTTNDDTNTSNIGRDMLDGTKALGIGLGHLGLGAGKGIAKLFKNVQFQTPMRKVTKETTSELSLLRLERSTAKNKLKAAKLVGLDKDTIQGLKDEIKDITNKITSIKRS